MPTRTERRSLGTIRADRIYDKVPPSWRRTMRDLPISRSRRRTLNRVLFHTDARQRSILIATAVRMGWPVAGVTQVLAVIFGTGIAAAWVRLRSSVDHAYRTRLFHSVVMALGADYRPNTERWSETEGWSEDAFRALTGGVESEILQEKERVARGFDRLMGITLDESLSLLQLAT